MKKPALAALMLLTFPAPLLADQAECEKTVRAMLAPFDENKPAQMVNRFGTVSTTINGTKQIGYSFQSPDGSVYYDADKNPVSLSFSTGENYWSADTGTTWTLSNPNSPEVMKEATDGLRSQAAKATNITCDYGIEFEGKTVNHYKVDHVM